MKRYKFFPDDYVKSIHPDFPDVKGVIVRIIEEGEEKPPTAVIEIEGDRDKRFIASVTDIELIPDID